MKFICTRLQWIVIFISIITLFFQAKKVSAVEIVDMGVGALIGASCSFTVHPIVFYGQYDKSQMDSISSVTATCTPGASYYIELDGGDGSNGNTKVRKMTNGEDSLDYNLYYNSARTNVWGTGRGQRPPNYIGSGLPQTYTIYGRIPANQPSAKGSYSDTVSASITIQ